MSFLPESEGELARQVVFALEDESFHPLDEVQDNAPAECRFFSDLESGLSDWSFGYGVAWTLARMRDPFASSETIAALARRVAGEAWRSYASDRSWPALMSRDRAERGPVRGDPATQLEEFTRNLGNMRIRRPASVAGDVAGDSLK
jgi:hypothetical protein